MKEGQLIRKISNQSATEKPTLALQTQSFISQEIRKNKEGKNNMPQHKQLELFDTKKSDNEKNNPKSISFHTSRFGKLSVSSTPMSFDLVIEILKPVFENTNSEEKH